MERAINAQSAAGDINATVLYQTFILHPSNDKRLLRGYFVAEFTNEFSHGATSMGREDESKDCIGGTVRLRYIAGCCMIVNWQSGGDEDEDIC